MSDDRISLPTRHIATEECGKCGRLFEYHKCLLPPPERTVLEAIRKRVGEGWHEGGVSTDVAVSRFICVLESESEAYHAALSEALMMLEAGDDAAAVAAMIRGELGKDEMECPRCGDVGAVAGPGGLFRDGQDLVCGCPGWT